MVIGDTVVRKSYDRDITFKVIDIREENGEPVYILKGISIRIIADSKADDLETVNEDYIGTQEKILNSRVSKAIKKAVKALRNYNASYDELVIFAGACQSCYECMLDAGANFASSPNRVLIHCLDPVFVCEKIAYTRIDQVVSITDVIENTITGIKGIGGLQTRGKYREGYPKSPYI